MDFGFGFSIWKIKDYKGWSEIMRGAGLMNRLWRMKMIMMLITRYDGPVFFPGQLNVLFCFFKYTAHGDLVGLGALRTVLSALYASQASSFVSLSSLLLFWKWMLCEEQGEQHMTRVWYTKLV